MESSGWSKVRAGSDDLVIRTDFMNDRFQILLTDLASVWLMSHSSQEILKSCEKFNPLIESTPDKLITHLRSIIKGGSSCEIVPDNSGFTLHISSKLDTLPFKWSFPLKLQESEKFRKYVTLPMLFMILESKSIEEELCNIIRDKDREIEDYKSSSAQLTRRYLETRTFNKEDFFAKRNVRSVDSSNGSDFFGTFCQATNHSYSAISHKILTNEQSATVGAGDYKPPVDVFTTSRSPGSSKKIAEAQRLEALKRRLREEETKEQSKPTKKNKPKLIL